MNDRRNATSSSVPDDPCGTTRLCRAGLHFELVLHQMKAGVYRQIGSIDTRIVQQQEHC